MEEENHISPGVYRYERKGTYFVYGEFRHTERPLSYIAYLALLAPYPARLCSKERFQLGLDTSHYEKDPVSASPVVPGIYQHFKGKDYYVYGEFCLAGTSELFVCYRALYESYAACVRPRDMFIEEVDRPDFNYKGPRFVLKHAF